MDTYITEQHFKLPEGVALNRDLKENLFAMLITTETRLASCILGSPGRGKTLAFEVLSQNLRGVQSPRDFCKRFMTVDPFIYQCSPESTATEIEHILSGATRREQMYQQHGGKDRCVPFFDEAQLPQESRMVMKPLHDVLDERQLATVIVSGSPLDAANMNRMLTFVRHQQTLQDFEQMGTGVLGTSLKGMQQPARTRSILRGLARGFHDIVRDVGFNMVFFERHYISLLRHLRWHCILKKGFLSSERVRRAIEENFQAPGVRIQDVVDIFFQAIGHELSRIGSGQHEFSNSIGTQTYRGCLDLAKACIYGDRQRCMTQGSPHLAPRFCMLLDCTCMLGIFLEL